MAFLLAEYGTVPFPGDADIVDHQVALIEYANEVSVLDALEAGLTAIKIDESRRTGQVVELTDTWARFDELTDD